MSDSQIDIYDFYKLEDMFEAIDTLTRATAVLASIDAQLSGDLVKLTNTLIDLSQNGFPQDSAAPPAEKGAGEKELDLNDLTTVVPQKKKKSFAQNDDEIIDVLTGQPINK